MPVLRNVDIFCRKYLKAYYRLSILTFVILYLIEAMGSKRGYIYLGWPTLISRIQMIWKEVHPDLTIINPLETNFPII